MASTIPPPRLLCKPLLHHTTRNCLVAIGDGSLLSLWAVVLEDLSFRKYRSRWDFFRLIGLSLIEGIGFGQMTVWFRLHAFWKCFREVKSWGAMTRERFGKTTV